MVTGLPHMLDLELLESENLDMESWIAQNSRLMNTLVSEAAEVLFKTDDDSVTLIEAYLDGEVAFMLDLARSNLEEALLNNEKNWVELEEYARAARSRDLRNQLKNI